MTGSGAVLDANALHPEGTRAGPRDTLLRAAEAGLYRPYWSAEILAEVERTLTRLLARRGRADADVLARRLLAHLAAHFPAALVAGYEPLLPTLANLRRTGTLWPPRSRRGRG
ncbi:MAG TPA: PIN domain-containing protein [Thermomicrobiales bacterium]|nr:PIN domain-containing protein [Thermomicrobiales bacterium]